MGKQVHARDAQHSICFGAFFASFESIVCASTTKLNFVIAPKVLYVVHVFLTRNCEYAR